MKKNYALLSLDLECKSAQCNDLELIFDHKAANGSFSKGDTIGLIEKRYKQSHPDLYKKSPKKKVNHTRYRIDFKPVLTNVKTLKLSQTDRCKILKIANTVKKHFELNINTTVFIGVYYYTAIGSVAFDENFMKMLANFGKIRINMYPCVDS